MEALSNPNPVAAYEPLLLSIDRKAINHQSVEKYCTLLETEMHKLYLEIQAICYDISESADKTI